MCWLCVDLWPAGVPALLAGCRGTLQEVDAVVAKARMFEYKPDGEVTIRMQQDAYGFPAPLMQVGGRVPGCSRVLAAQATSTRLAAGTPRSALQRAGCTAFFLDCHVE